MMIECATDEITTDVAYRVEDLVNQRILRIIRSTARP